MQRCNLSRSPTTKQWFQKRYARDTSRNRTSTYCTNGAKTPPTGTNNSLTTIKNMSQQYESHVKIIPYSQECVYGKISDMNNLGVLRDKLNDPDNAERLRQQMTEEQLSQAKERLKDMKFDRDSVSTNVPPIGNISLRIINREEPKCVKLEAVGS